MNKPVIIGTATLHLGDCLDVMPGIADESIDMILADLPYGTTECAWDSVIDLQKLWSEYKRIIKPSGAIVLTSAQPFTAALVMSNLEMYRTEWIWEKGAATGFLNANKQPMRAHENVLVFYKKQPAYTNEGMLVLDNTMGSGTFGVSAVNTNRPFIGIEKPCEEFGTRHFDTACVRIADAQQQQRMFA